MKPSYTVNGYSFIIEDVLEAGKKDKAAWVKSIAKSHWPGKTPLERAQLAVASYDAIVKFDADSKAEAAKESKANTEVSESKKKEAADLDAAVIAALGGNTKSAAAASNKTEVAK